MWRPLFLLVSLVAACGSSIAVAGSTSGGEFPDDAGVDAPPDAPDDAHEAEACCPIVCIGLAPLLAVCCPDAGPCDPPTGLACQAAPTSGPSGWCCEGTPCGP